MAKLMDEKDVALVFVIMFALVGLLVIGGYTYHLENRYNECAVKYNNLSRVMNPPQFDDGNFRIPKINFNLSLE